jgi:hypothetical protein
VASFAQILGDPSALQQGAASAALEQVRAELDAVTAAVSGYAEYVTNIIANRLIGNTTPIGEAMRRRRVSRGDGEKVAETLFGLRLDQAQIDRGGRFVAGVLDRSGELQLARMWTEANHLPTPAEVDAPGLWLARLELPEDSGAAPALPGGGDFFLRHAEVPLEDDVLPFGVADDALPIAAELRVMGRQQHQACQRPLTKLLDHAAVPELRLDLPVRCHWTEVHHADMAARRLRGLFLLRYRAHGHRGGV